VSHEAKKMGVTLADVERPAKRVGPMRKNIEAELRKKKKIFLHAARADMPTENHPQGNAGLQAFAASWFGTGLFRPPQWPGLRRWPNLLVLKTASFLQRFSRPRLGGRQKLQSAYSLQQIAHTFRGHFAFCRIGLGRCTSFVPPLYEL
jgi:hypothetical protein